MKEEKIKRDKEKSKKKNGLRLRRLFAKVTEILKTADV